MLTLKGTSIRSLLCADLQRTPAPAPAVDAALAEGANALLIVGYGTDDEVRPHVRALMEAAQARGLKVQDALRVHQNRFFSQLCEDTACCPAEGTEIDPAHSTGPAEAVLHGLSPTPPLYDRVEAAGADTRSVPASEEVIEQATTDAEAEAGRLSMAGPRVLRRCSAAAVRTAIDAEKEGSGPTGVEELVRLAVFLRERPVRDHAWADIDTETARAHRELWQRVTHAARLSDRAAPACLVAIAAWMEHDTDGARAALRVAENAEPGYSMAHLVGHALDVGLPPHKWVEHMRNR